MIKKLAISALAFLGAAQATPSSFYVGAGLGYVGGKAPIMTSRKVYDQLVPGKVVKYSVTDVKLPKGQLNGIAAQLRLGYKVFFPKTSTFLGTEVAFGLTGPKKKTNISWYGQSLIGKHENYLSRKLDDRGNITFTGVVGVKVGCMSPYLKAGVALHSFKWSEKFENFVQEDGVWRTLDKLNYSEERTKTRPLFVIGLGAEYTLSKNISVGAEWLHRRGTLGVYKTAQKEREVFVDARMLGIGRLNESNKIYMNEFMVTCKYAFPVN